MLNIEINNVNDIIVYDKQHNPVMSIPSNNIINNVIIEIDQKGADNIKFEKGAPLIVTGKTKLFNNDDFTFETKGTFVRKAEKL